MGKFISQDDKARGLGAIKTLSEGLGPILDKSPKTDQWIFHAFNLNREIDGELSQDPLLLDK